MTGDARRYSVGPTLPPGERPWPIGWEHEPQTQARIHDGHAHAWECVLIVRDEEHRHIEEAVRCAVCHAPRCGHSTDENPCLDVRHHACPHHYARGGVEPVGGLW